MTTLDPWYLIFDKAGDLADSLLHEQPKSKIDAVDIEEQIISSVKEIASGEVNPREDWSVIIRLVNKKGKLDEKIEEHGGLNDQVQHVSHQVRCCHDLLLSPSLC